MFTLRMHFHTPAGLDPYGWSSAHSEAERAIAIGLCMLHDIDPPAPGEPHPNRFTVEDATGAVLFDSDDENADPALIPEDIDGIVYGIEEAA